MLMAALFTIAKTWKPECPLTDEWIKMWSIHTMEYYLAMCVLVTQLCLTLCDPMDCMQLARLFCP